MSALILSLRMLVIRADGGHATGVLEEPIRPEEPIVHKLLLKRAGGVVPPERVQQLDGPVGVVHQQAVPGQHCADGTTRSTAQSHDLVVVLSFDLLFEELLQHSRRKSRVASATLAGNRNPPIVVLGHRASLSLFSLTCISGLCAP